SENYIFHARIFGGGHPFFRIEMLWIKGGLQVFIFLFVSEIIRRIGPLALRPAFIFWTETPTFNNTPLTIGAPMHEEPEFQILPFGYVFLYQWICRLHIPLLGTGKKC